MPIVLDEQQRKAIAHGHGPMMVVAGAGTGKTTVLVERIASLIREGAAKPSEILAVTYTDNAAKVLRQRVEKLVGRKCGELRAQTFHAYCNGILHEAKQSFGVVDDYDLYVYLRRRIAELPLQHYSRAASPGQFLESLTDFFSRCHDELVEAADYARYVDDLGAGRWPLPRVVSAKKFQEVSDTELLARCREISAVYTKVEQMLREDGLGTFGHMILRAVRLLQSNPEKVARERERARFLLIDEFQDANLAQIELAQLLGGAEQNVFAVGDPDQAIYRFRGASSGAFSEFARRFPKTRLAVLSQNQRSLPPVLKCAYGVIARNAAVDCAVNGAGGFQRQPLESGRARRWEAEGGLPLWPQIEVVACASDEDEAADVAAEIERLLREPKKRPKSALLRFGVLYRGHAHRELVMRELSVRGLAFDVKGINALETKDVRDLLACLRAIRNPADGESLLRVAALPMFGLVPEVMREAMAGAGRDTTFESVLRSISGGEAVLSEVAETRSLAQPFGMMAVAVIDLAISRFRLNRSSLSLIAFRNFVSDWEKKPITNTRALSELLEYLDFFYEKGGTVELPVGGDESDADVVQLMSVHAAKGMEFEHVFLLRLNSGAFPTGFREKLFEFPPELRKSASAEGESREVHIQEERRLFYVGMTRARDSLRLYARVYRNRKEQRPQGFTREVMDSPIARSFWTMRPAATYRTSIAAAAPAAGIGSWMIMPPSARVSALNLSVTAIESYETCPLQFKLAREWRLPADAAALRYGNAVHTVLKDYYDALKLGRPRAPEEVLRMFQMLLESAHFDDPVQRDLYLRDGNQQLSRFMDLRSREAHPDILHTERAFELKVGDVVLRGRVDRVDRLQGECVVITDYKTGSPRTQRDADKSLQLSIYAMAAREVWSFNPERLVLYNLTDNTAVEATRTQTQLDKARERVEIAAEGIGSGDFGPNPGYHCRWCVYRSLCPATEQDVALPLLLTNEGK